MKLLRYMGSVIMAIARADRQLSSICSKLGNWKLQEVFLSKYLYEYYRQSQFKKYDTLTFFLRRSKGMINKELRSYLDYMC